MICWIIVTGVGPRWGNGSRVRCARFREWMNVLNMSVFFPLFLFLFFHSGRPVYIVRQSPCPSCTGLDEDTSFQQKVQRSCFIKLCTVQGADSFQSLGKFRKLKGFLVCCKILKKYGKLKTMKPVWVWKKYELSLKKKRKKRIFFPFQKGQ